MEENSKLSQFLPQTSGQDFGYVMGLVETIRLLTCIDKKLYVIIKKLEVDTGKSERTTYAEDMGYQPPDSEEHDLGDK